MYAFSGLARDKDLQSSTVNIKVLSFSNLWFFFKMSFHFQNVKGFVSVVFPFSGKHNCKQKSVHLLQIALLMRL